MYLLLITSGALWLETTWIMVVFTKRYRGCHGSEVFVPGEDKSANATRVAYYSASRLSAYMSSNMKKSNVNIWSFTS